MPPSPKVKGAARGVRSPRGSPRPARSVLRVGDAAAAAAAVPAAAAGVTGPSSDGGASSLAPTTTPSASTTTSPFNRFARERQGLRQCSVDAALRGSVERLAASSAPVLQLGDATNSCARAASLPVGKRDAADAAWGGEGAGGPSRWDGSNAEVRRMRRRRSSGGSSVRGGGGGNDADSSVGVGGAGTLEWSCEDELPASRPPRRSGDGAALALNRKNSYRRALVDEGLPLQELRDADDTADVPPPSSSSSQATSPTLSGSSSPGEGGVPAWSVEDLSPTGRAMSSSSSSKRGVFRRAATYSSGLSSSGSHNNSRRGDAAAAAAAGSVGGSPMPTQLKSSLKYRSGLVSSSSPVLVQQPAAAAACGGGGGGVNGRSPSPAMSSSSSSSPPAVGDDGHRHGNGTRTRVHTPVVLAATLRRRISDISIPNLGKALRAHR